MCLPSGEGRLIWRARELAHDGKDRFRCCERLKGELNEKEGKVLAKNVLVFRGSKGGTPVAEPLPRPCSPYNDVFYFQSRMCLMRVGKRSLIGGSRCKDPCVLTRTQTDLGHSGRECPSFWSMSVPGDLHSHIGVKLSVLQHVASFVCFGLLPSF